MQLEASPHASIDTMPIHISTIIYHLKNICLYPEEILRYDATISVLSSLYKKFAFPHVNTSETSIISLVKDIVEANICHSKNQQLI
jgi:hypothetical protein